MNTLLQNKILAALSRTNEWLESVEQNVPLYMSADIRDAGFKIASIDANLYPAGFNNLDESFHALAASELKGALARCREAEKRLAQVMIEGGWLQ